MSDKKQTLTNKPTWVHRCRFLEYQPSSILCIAFHRKGDRVAVARGNGDIEIWNISNRWHLECIVRGKESIELTKLIWTETGRLFASSINGTILEIDFLNLNYKNIRDSNGGAVWTMEYDARSQLLALGCEDGRIRFFIIENDSLEFQKAFVSTGTRVLSLAWDHERNLLYSGDSEGIIHRWDIKLGRNTDRITLDSSKNQKAIIWSLLALRDGTIVSGDSLGNIQLWDGETSTLIQQFVKMSADVLTMVVNQEEDRIFASGIDTRVIMLQKIQEKNKLEENSSTCKWQYIFSHRSHSHDVRALAVSHSTCLSKTNSNTPIQSILISGGIDTQLVWYPVSQFASSRPSRIPPFPQHSVIQMSNTKRLMLVEQSTSLELYQFDTQATVRRPCKKNLNEMNKEFSTPCLKLQINMKTSDPSNIVCSAISANGQYIACSNTHELKLYQLDENNSNGFKPKKIKLSNELSQPAHRILFTMDSTRLIIATQSNMLKILDLTSMKIIQTFSNHFEAYKGDKRHEINETKWTYDKLEMSTAICTLCISYDGQWLASGDLQNNIYLYQLDRQQFYGTLPRPEAMHTTMSFCPTGNVLVVANVRNSFVSYDVDSKTISQWSRENGHLFPRTLFSRGGKIKGIIFPPNRPSTCILYSQKYFISIDLTKPLPICSSFEAKNTKSPSKRKRSNTMDETDKEDEMTELKNFSLVEKYHPIFYMDFLKERELVIVETPWIHIMNRLPNMLYRQRYGTA